MNVVSLQEKRRRKIEENLHLFQEHFWEWVLPIAGNRARNVRACLSACGGRRISGLIFVGFAVLIFITIRYFMCGL